VYLLGYPLQCPAQSTVDETMTENKSRILRDAATRLAASAGGIFEKVVIELCELLHAEMASLRAEESTAAQYVTVAAYAKAHSLSQSTVRVHIREDRLDAIRVGRAVRVRADASTGRPNPPRDPGDERIDRILGLTRPRRKRS
jgi:hypothetical protein